MKSEYRIYIHAKTAAGFETIGKFYVGTNEDRALRLFRSLKGSPEDPRNALLIMELCSVWRGLPLDIQMIHCTLDEVEENCRIITKQAFNSFNLGQSSVS